MTNLPICTNLPNHSVDISPQVIDNQGVKPKTTKSYWFLRRRRNPDYETGQKVVPLRSCLLLNNVLKNDSQGNSKWKIEKHSDWYTELMQYQEEQPITNWIVKTKPKWYVDLLESIMDKETGEILSQGVYTTDDLTSGNYRKIKAVNRFCSHFNPLYRKRKVSLFFGALTLANQSKVDIRKLTKLYKQRLKRNGVDVLGFLWVLEISDTLHVHYHFLMATNRLNFKGSGMPEFIKPTDIWGCRTGIEFVKFDVRYYLATYFVKCKYRIEKHRTYGISMPK